MDCKYGDTTCPCQDGDTCHYIDDPITNTKAMPVRGSNSILVAWKAALAETTVTEEQVLESRIKYIPTPKNN
jgi:hypothetical protein